ncbi:MAG: helix-turn-helix domain-containing protein [Desulfobacterales bacterium]|nr:helix-turn-helix domain-containing protein [Desulfobacterales bacterium]
MDLAKRLSENPLFSVMDPGEIQQMMDLGITREYPKGQWVSHYGSSWPYLFLVEEGQITALNESPGGRSLVVMILEEGEVFWGVGFFKEGIGMPVALVADQESRIRIWTQDRLLPFLLNNGKFTWALTQLMVERMLVASQILEELAFQPVAGRLAHLLLEQFEDQSGDTLTRDMTLDDMAARIGSTREMVCRHLYQFADRGAIQINRTEFKVTDQDMLQHFAGKGKRQ